MKYFQAALHLIVILAVFFGGEVGGFLLCTGPLNIHDTWIFLASAVFNLIFLPLYFAGVFWYLDRQLTKKGII